MYLSILIISGRHTPQKDVLAIVNQLNIQVDNLW